MAIPDTETILAAFGAAGFEVSEKAVRAAVQEARALARWPIDEPAALFFAFAQRPRAVPKLSAKTALFLARDQVRALGLGLSVADDELRELRMRIVERRVTYEDVRAWFAERIPGE